MPEPRRVLLLAAVPVLMVLAILAAGMVAERTRDGDDAAEPGGTVPRRPLVVLVRYGGPDGATDRVEVDASGEAVVTSDRLPTPRVQMLSATDFTALRNALERSRISALQRSYLDPRAEIAFQYDVTYQDATVTTDAGVVPERLQPVIDILDRLLE